MKKIVLLVMALFLVACGGDDGVTFTPDLSTVDSKEPSKFCQCRISWANGRKIDGGILFGDNSPEPDRQLSIGVELVGDAPELADVWITVRLATKQAVKAPSNVYWAEFVLPSYIKHASVEAFTINTHCLKTSFLYGLR